MVIKLSKEEVLEEGTYSKMSPELFCFLTSALCAMLLVGIESYHSLNTKHYRGSVIPLVEGFVVKVYDEKRADEMDPEEIV